MSDLQNLLIKAFLVLVTAPAWWPFLKAVWEEFNEAMADEGGLFGRHPTPLELQDLERRKLGAEEPLLHEPWPGATAERQRKGSRSQAPRPGPSGGPRRRPTSFR